MYNGVFKHHRVNGEHYLSYVPEYSDGDGFHVKFCPTLDADSPEFKLKMYRLAAKRLLEEAGRGFND